MRSAARLALFPYSGGWGGKGVGEMDAEQGCTGKSWIDKHGFRSRLDFQGEIWYRRVFLIRSLETREKREHLAFVACRLSRINRFVVTAINPF